MVRGFEGKMPSIDETSFVADSAELIGEVILHKDSNIWFNAVLRGDIARVEVGEGSNIQDGTVCHVDYDKPVIVGRNVTVGHNVTLHACTVGDGSLIGMGAVVLDDAEIGEESLVGAGAVVTPRTKIPPRSMVLGYPAKVQRRLRDDEIEGIKHNGRLYIELAKKHKGGSNG